MTSAFIDPGDAIPERADPPDGDAAVTPDDDRLVDLDDTDDGISDDGTSGDDPLSR